MAFLCPVRIPRRRRKRHDGENSEKNGAPKGRITGSNSVDSLVGLGKDNDEEEIEFEPRKMVVLHDFIPCVEDEVSVKRGEHVKALYQETDWSYIIKRDNAEGFVPFTYCVSEEEYEKRKEKQKTASSHRKNFRISPCLDPMVTEACFERAEFPKKNYGEFIVKFNFDASDEDDVSVRKGEIVLVLNKEDQDWFWVRKKSGEEGFIPKDFVTKIEQIAPSRSLANGGRTSRSNPNIYNSSRVSPHLPELTATSYTSFSRVDQGSLSLNSRAMQEASTVVIGNYSPNGTNSSQSSPCTPVVSADQSSSMSRVEQNSPYSSHIQAVPPSTSVVKSSSPGGVTSNHSSPNNPDVSEKHFSSTPMTNHITNTSNGLRTNAPLPSTPALTGGSHAENQQHPTVTHKLYSSMPGLDQRAFSPDNSKTYPHSSLPGRSYDYQSRRKSNELLLYGQELVCIDTYVGRKTDELTVHKGDWVYADMKYRDGRGWIWAYSPATKKQGFFPKSCLRPPATTPL